MPEHLPLQPGQQCQLVAAAAAQEPLLPGQWSLPSPAAPGHLRAQRDPSKRPAAAEAPSVHLQTGPLSCSAGARACWRPCRHWQGLATCELESEAVRAAQPPRETQQQERELAAAAAQQQLSCPGPAWSCPWQRCCCLSCWKCQPQRTPPLAASASPNRQRRLLMAAAARVQPWGRQQASGTWPQQHQFPWASDQLPHCLRS